MTTISVDTNICSMVIRGRTIYYCAWSKGLKMLNLDDKSVSDIINRDMYYVNYVEHLETNYTTQTGRHIP